MELLAGRGMGCLMGPISVDAGSNGGQGLPAEKFQKGRELSLGIMNS